MESNTASNYASFMTGQIVDYGALFNAILITELHLLRHMDSTSSFHLDRKPQSFLYDWWQFGIGTHSSAKRCISVSSNVHPGQDFVVQGRLQRVGYLENTALS